MQVIFNRGMGPRAGELETVRLWSSDLINEANFMTDHKISEKVVAFIKKELAEQPRLQVHFDPKKKSAFLSCDTVGYSNGNEDLSYFFKGLSC